MHVATALANTLAQDDLPDHPTLIYAKSADFERAVAAVDQAWSQYAFVLMPTFRVWVFGQGSSLTVALAQ
jgi:hypothetical protein